MIKPECLRKLWIDRVAQNYTTADPILVEKAIRALYLLEHLKLRGLEFIFKGGETERRREGERE